MKKIAYIALFSGAVAFIAFCLVTMRTDVAYVDGPPLSFYGFPYPYIRFSQVSSLWYFIDLKYLALDFALYYFVAMVIVSRKVVYDVLIRRKWVAISTTLASSILLILSLVIPSFYFDDTIIEEEAIKGRGTRITFKGLHVGLGRPYHPPDYGAGP